MELGDFSSSAIFERIMLQFGNGLAFTGESNTSVLQSAQGILKRVKE
jgi:hypothetical protein